MPWMLILGLLFNLLGHLLSAWLRPRLEARLKDAAETMPAGAEYQSSKHAVAALFDRAIDLTSTWQGGERAALRLMKSLALPRADDVCKAAGLLTPTYGLDVVGEVVGVFEDCEEFMRAGDNRRGLVPLPLVVAEGLASELTPKTATPIQVGD